jgi:hypothetical protein
VKHLITPFIKKHDAATCEAAFALVAAVLQDDGIQLSLGSGSCADSIIDRAAQDFAAAASDARRKMKE